jgi:hypothetical protein
MKPRNHIQTERATETEQGDKGIQPTVTARYSMLQSHGKKIGKTVLAISNHTFSYNRECLYFFKKNTRKISLPSYQVTETEKLYKQRRFTKTHTVCLWVLYCEHVQMCRRGNICTCCSKHVQMCKQRRFTKLRKLRVVVVVNMCKC